MPVITDRPTSGLIIEIPEAEAVVGHLRARLDPNADRGVVAHVTVLYPFVPPMDLDDAVIDRLRRLFATVPPFPYAFSRTSWFDDRVLWLAPEDDRAFRGLTAAVHAEFPQHPPFDGAYADVVPHLTIGHEAPVSALRSADAELADLAPIRGSATEVTLLEQQQPEGPYAVRAVLPLG